MTYYQQFKLNKIAEINRVMMNLS